MVSIEALKLVGKASSISSARRAIVWSISLVRSKKWPSCVFSVLKIPKSKEMVSEYWAIGNIKYNVSTFEFVPTAQYGGHHL